MSAKHVYFISAAETRRIKVGIAKNVANRFQHLHTASSVALEILGVIPNGGIELEREIHMRFSAARLHGEWFLATPQLLQYIADHATPVPTPRFNPRLFGMVDTIVRFRAGDAADDLALIASRETQGNLSLAIRRAIKEKAERIRAEQGAAA